MSSPNAAASPRGGNVRDAMLLLLIFLVLPVSVQGADQDGKYAIKGVGMGRCGDYVKARSEKSNAYLQFAGWLNGFLTHHNRGAAATFDISPWQNTDLLLALLDGHCKNKPEQRFVHAIDALVNTLQEQRLRAGSRKVEVKAGAASVYLYEETVRQVQRALASGGYYRGAVDGAFGPKTEAAIRAFQKDKQLPVTGLPNQGTLLVLLLLP